MIFKVLNHELELNNIKVLNSIYEKSNSESQKN